eukprot:GFUD01111867.1.p1 GENE.GFUD01111867.1~~GFUD01111867.1.p1  ORF type:complete len:102 (+),score=16.41 GFUD01111867.1:135-440(+)
MRNFFSGEEMRAFYLASNHQPALTGSLSTDKYSLLVVTAPTPNLNFRPGHLSQGPAHSVTIKDCLVTKRISCQAALFLSLLSVPLTFSLSYISLSLLILAS